MGYGPDPNLVTEWAREHVAYAVRGNHDKACTEGTGLVDFSPLAYTAALWTRKEISNENADYLRTLSQGPMTVDGFSIVHGSPRDEDEYLIESYEAENAFHYIEERITLFGHTHVQGGFQTQRSKVKTIPVAEPELSFGENTAYLINPGSVGQPRDRNPAAAYAVFTPDDAYLTFRRVTYAIQETQSKIRNAGLPALLADRLAAGM